MSCSPISLPSAFQRGLKDSGDKAEEIEDVERSQEEEGGESSDEDGEGEIESLMTSIAEEDLNR